MIRTLLRYEISPDYRDELVDRIKGILTDLDGHVSSTEGGQLRITDLEVLAEDLRLMPSSFLVPQHPQFAVEFDEITKNLRSEWLSWLSASPSKEQAVGALKNARDRLKSELDNYAPPAIGY